MTDQKSLFADLKDRRVFRAVLVYAVVGWGVFEIVESITPYLNLPEWLPKVALIVLLVGFPVVAGLAWAFDVKPSGVQPAGGGRGRMVVAMLGATLLAVVIGVYTVRTSFRSEAPIELDANRIAVLPFRASVGGELQDWIGGGVADLLSARLAEEPGLDVADQYSVFAALDGMGESPDRDTLAGIAARLGAGRMVVGTVSGVGELSASAELIDVLDGSTLARDDARGPADSLTVIVDRLAAQLLSLDAGELRERVRYIASSPPDAVGSFLRGRAHYRAGRYREAMESFRESLRADSTFALAGMGLAESVGMNMVQPAGLAASGWRAAYNNRDRLPPTDRDFLRFRLGERYPEARTTSEAIADGRQAVQLFPDRTEAHYFLGDLLMHTGIVLDEPEWRAQAWGAFERMLEIDPALTVAQQHLFWLALDSGDTLSARPFADALLEMGDDPFAEWETALVFGHVSEMERLAAEIPEASDEALVGMAFTSSFPWVQGSWPLNPDAADAAIDELSRRTSDQEQPATLARLEMERGRPESALRMFDEYVRRTGNRGRADREILLYDFFEDFDVPGVEEAAARLASGEAVWPDDPGPLRIRVREVCALEIWRAGRAEFAGVDDAVDRLRSVDSGDRHVDAEARGCATTLEAIRAVYEGREGAAELLDEVEDWVGGGPVMVTSLEFGLMILVGRLREEAGDLEGAHRTLQRCCPSYPTSRYFNAWRRASARIAAQQGDRATAARLLDRYLAVRANAEPSVRPQLEQVRSDLARLVDEPTGN